MNSITQPDKSQTRRTTTNAAAPLIYGPESRRFDATRGKGTLGTILQIALKLYDAEVGFASWSS